MIHVLNKGRNFERQVAKVLTQWYGKEITRVPLSGGYPKRQQWADLICYQDGNFPLLVSCKKVRSVDLWSVVLGRRSANLIKWVDEVCRILQLHIKHRNLAGQFPVVPIVIFATNRSSMYGILKLSDLQKVASMVMDTLIIFKQEDLVLGELQSLLECIDMEKCKELRRIYYGF